MKPDAPPPPLLAPPDAAATGVQICLTCTELRAGVAVARQLGIFNREGGPPRIAALLRAICRGTVEVRRMEDRPGGKFSKWCRRKKEVVPGRHRGAAD